jgi:hypothetical protein
MLHKKNVIRNLIKKILIKIGWKVNCPHKKTENIFLEPWGLFFVLGGFPIDKKLTLYISTKFGFNLSSSFYEEDCDADDDDRRKWWQYISWPFLLGQLEKLSQYVIIFQ